MRSTKASLPAKPDNVTVPLVRPNRAQPPVPLVECLLLLAVVTVPIVHAGDVGGLRVIQNALDHEPRHSGTGHVARRRASEIVAAEILDSGSALFRDAP